MKFTPIICRVIVDKDYNVEQSVILLHRHQGPHGRLARNNLYFCQICNPPKINIITCIIMNAKPLSMLNACVMKPVLRSMSYGSIACFFFFFLFVCHYDCAYRSPDTGSANKGQSAVFESVHLTAIL